MKPAIINSNGVRYFDYKYVYRIHSDQISDAHKFDDEDVITYTPSRTSHFTWLSNEHIEHDDSIYIITSHTSGRYTTYRVYSDINIESIYDLFMEQLRTIHALKDF